jgi:signal transduction histidine kinase
VHVELELAGQPDRTRAELAAAVNIAADETRRLTRLANNLLLLAQQDEGAALARPDNQPLAPVLRASVEAAAPRALGNGVALDMYVPDGLCALVDADRIRQAVDNLLDNALRVAPAGSDIAVNARQEAATVVIEVLDHGPGFPTAFLPEAFERFRRADTDRGRRAGGSAGLGLAIVRATAEAHGGRAVAANRAEGGAAVRIIIPSPP